MEIELFVSIGRQKVMFFDGGVTNYDNFEDEFLPPMSSEDMVLFISKAREREVGVGSGELFFNC